MQRQKQHFYQESQNDGNQKQRENYSFHNMRWKSSEKPERHEERTVTKQSWDKVTWIQRRTKMRQTILQRQHYSEGGGAFTCVRPGELTSPIQSGHMIFLRAGQNSRSSTTRQTFLPQYDGMCDQPHCTHMHAHTHTHLSLPSSCGSIAVTAGKSSQSTKQCHFQLSGGLKADSPGNDAAGRKSAPVSRHGSHAATRLWIKRQ